MLFAAYFDLKKKFKFRNRNTWHTRHLKQQTSLHFASEDSADITYDLHFQLHPEPQDFPLFVCLFTRCGQACPTIH